MENLYDQAHALARSIRESDQARAYHLIKDEVMADEANRRMIRDFRNMQLQAQGMMLAGEEVPADLKDKLQKMGEVLQFNPKITQFFAAEYAIQTLAADMYKIIADACDLDMSMLEEQ